MTSGEKKAVTDLIVVERKRATESLLAAGYSPPVIYQMKLGHIVSGFSPDENMPRKREGEAVTVSGHTAYWASEALNYIRLFEEAFAKGSYGTAIKYAFQIGAAGQRQDFEAYSLRGSSKGGKKRVSKRNKFMEDVIALAKTAYHRAWDGDPKKRITMEWLYDELPKKMKKKVGFSTFKRRFRAAGGIENFTAQ